MFPRNRVSHEIGDTAAERRCQIDLVLLMLAAGCKGRAIDVPREAPHLLPVEGGT